MSACPSCLRIAGDSAPERLLSKRPAMPIRPLTIAEDACWIAAALGLSLDDDLAGGLR